MDFCNIGKRCRHLTIDCLHVNRFPPTHNQTISLPPSLPTINPIDMTEKHSSPPSLPPSLPISYSTHHPSPKNQNLPHIHPATNLTSPHSHPAYSTLIPQLITFVPHSPTPEPESHTHIHIHPATNPHFISVYLAFISAYITLPYLGKRVGISHLNLLYLGGRVGR